MGGVISPEQLFSILARVLVLFTCIPIHECAHGWAASRLGDNTAKDLGRLTLNPIKHLDALGTFALVFLGFGWAKPVPVNPNNFRGDRKRGMAITAAAGPAANVLMAFVIMIIYKLTIIALALTNTWDRPFAGILMQILWIMVSTNITLAVFNLLPVNPLDGSRIFGLFLPDKIYYKLVQYERYLYFALILALAFGILDIPIAFLSNKALQGLDFLTSFIDKIVQLVL